MTEMSRIDKQQKATEIIYTLFEMEKFNTGEAVAVLAAVIHIICMYSDDPLFEYKMVDAKDVLVGYAEEKERKKGNEC